MKKIFTHTVSGTKTTVSLDTSNLFDKTYQEPTSAPIDLFYSDLAMSVKLLGEPPNPLTPEWKFLANLTVLGVVSSVETYFRRVIRRTLTFDMISQNKSYDKTLSYGAAIHHDFDLLPEALMEETTFSTLSSIKENLNKFLDISVAQSKKVMSALDAFEVVCNLRHCIVHRSGKLGSKNAIRFGLNEYSDCLEKPVEVDFDSVNEIFQVCLSLVQEINDYLFIELLKRSSKSIPWENDLRKDKKKLKLYYDLFSKSSQNNLVSIKECHKELMSAIYTG
jgi:hypothetical protein